MTFFNVIGVSTVQWQVTYESIRAEGKGKREGEEEEKGNDQGNGMRALCHPSKPSPLYLPLHSPSLVLCRTFFLRSPFANYLIYPLDRMLRLSLSL